ITQLLTVPPEGLPEALAKLLWDYRSQDVLLAVLDANTAARPLVGKTLTALLGLDAGSEFFTPALTVQRWEVLREHLDLPTFLKRIDGDGGLTALVRSGDFRAEHASLYRSLLQHGSRTSELAEWCADGLRALSADAWVTGLEVRADTITLLLLC